MQAKPSEVVEKAIEILDDKGWCQNNFVNPDGKVCLEEALGRANWIVSKNSVMPEDVYSGVRETTGISKYAFLSEWNDRPERTVEEVKDVLMRTAKQFRNEGR